MASHPKVEMPSNSGGTSQEVPDEMMAELKKEIARNVEATKLVKQREMEATFARDRAADSQRRMHKMMIKYDEMKKKLEWTRLTLAETHSRLEHHNSARSERIKQAVHELKEKTDSCTQKLQKRNGELAEEEEAATNVTEEDGGGGGLTDAERMLLQLCQEQRKKDLEAVEDVDPSPLAEIPVIPEASRPTKNYAQTVLNLQTKLSSSKTQLPKQMKPSEAQVEPEEQKAVDVQEEDKSCLKEETVVFDELVLAPEESVVVLAEPLLAPVEPELVEVPNPISQDHEEPSASKCCPKPSVTSNETIGIEEITMDLNDTVSMMEAKVAGVREELGQMAMSEQYMRTKQAQLLAKKREKEAQLALEIAAKKEREAEFMRKKVTDMMKLLEERRNKLRITEVVLEKKAVVVEKVNNILDDKERRANAVEKQRAECLAIEEQAKKESE